MQGKTTSANLVINHTFYHHLLMLLHVYSSMHRQYLLSRLFCSSLSLFPSFPSLIFQCTRYLLHPCLTSWFSFFSLRLQQDYELISGVCLVCLGVLLSAAGGSSTQQSLNFKIFSFAIPASCTSSTFPPEMEGRCVALVWGEMGGEGLMALQNQSSGCF